MSICCVHYQRLAKLGKDHHWYEVRLLSFFSFLTVCFVLFHTARVNTINLYQVVGDFIPTKWKKNFFWMIQLNFHLKKIISFT